MMLLFFFSSRRRHTRSTRDWSSDVCSSDLANLQRARRGAEAVKRVASRLPHWWFAYTEGSRARVEALGFSPERITVVQNAVDTAGLRRLRSEPADGEVRPVAAMLGGLY